MVSVKDTNKNMTYKAAAASTEIPKFISPQSSVTNLQPCQETPLLPDIIAATNPVTTSIQSSSSVTEEANYISSQTSVQTASENLQPCQNTPLLPDLIAATNQVTAITGSILTTSIQSI